MSKFKTDAKIWEEGSKWKGSIERPSRTTIEVEADSRKSLIEELERQLIDDLSKEDQQQKGKGQQPVTHGNSRNIVTSGTRDIVTIEVEHPQQHS